ncbi:MAG: hypothetical protein F6K65_13860, partial [Moorea sp. SIO3C2]|nr:hypothetical protein [Moorena sp. SIO3C2]
MTGRRRALVIGVKTFGEGLNEIPSAVNDVQVMKKVLEEKGGFEVTKKENPNRDEMEVIISNFFQSSQKSDTLFVYISSHGLINKSERFYIAASNTSYDKNTQNISGAIDARYLHDEIKNSPSNSQVWLLDLCYASAFVSGFTKGLENSVVQQLLNQAENEKSISKGVSSDNPVEINQSQQSNQEGLVIITSSAMDQKSYLMKDDSNLSICTYYAIEA